MNIFSPKAGSKYLFRREYRKADASKNFCLVFVSN